MDRIDSFAFLLPFILLTFGAAFLIVSRYQKRPALSWGVGYVLAAMAFAAPVVLSWLPLPFMAIVADTLFIGAFYFYGAAMLEQFQRPPYRRIRSVLALAGVAAAVYADLIAGSLELELLFNDTATVLLLAVPLIACLRHSRHWLDGLLLVLAGLVTLETILRNVFLVWLMPPQNGLEAFATSTYAAMMQTTATFVALLLALTALARVATDMLIGYRKAAERDPLTDMFNRRGFEQTAQDATAPAGRQGAVIVCDIDHFKRINDDFGHHQGDRVLVTMAALLTRYLPSNAIAARFGGEEFVIFLPGYDLAEAEVLANMLRLALFSHDWRDIGIPRQVTASFGCAVGDAADRSIHERIARADANLYAAKHDGRNRVVAFPGRGGGPVSAPPVRSCST